MNTSFPVYQQSGSITGLYTFRLTSRGCTFPKTDEIALGMGLVYDNRPDISFMSKHTQMLPHHHEDILQLYSTHRRGLRVIDIEHHLHSGTYLHVEDAHIIAQAYNTRLSEVPSPFKLRNDGVNILREPKDFAAIGHL